MVPKIMLLSQLAGCLSSSPICSNQHKSAVVKLQLAKRNIFTKLRLLPRDCLYRVVAVSVCEVTNGDKTMHLIWLRSGIYGRLSVGNNSL